MPWYGNVDIAIDDKQYVLDMQKILRLPPLHFPRQRPQPPPPPPPRSPPPPPPNSPPDRRGKKEPHEVKKEPQPPFKSPPEVVQIDLLPFKTLLIGLGVFVGIVRVLLILCSLFFERI